MTTRKLSSSQTQDRKLLGLGVRTFQYERGTFTCIRDRLSTIKTHCCIGKGNFIFNLSGCLARPKNLN